MLANAHIWEQMLLLVREFKKQGICATHSSPFHLLLIPLSFLLVLEEKVSCCLFKDYSSHSQTLSPSPSPLLENSSTNFSLSVSSPASFPHPHPRPLLLLPLALRTNTNMFRSPGSTYTQVLPLELSFPSFSSSPCKRLNKVICSAYTSVSPPTYSSSLVFALPSLKSFSGMSQVTPNYYSCPI